MKIKCDKTDCTREVNGVVDRDFPVLSGDIFAGKCPEHGDFQRHLVVNNPAAKLRINAHGSEVLVCQAKDADVICGAEAIITNRIKSKEKGVHAQKYEKFTGYCDQHGRIELRRH